MWNEMSYNKLSFNFLERMRLEICSDFDEYNYLNNFLSKRIMESYFEETTEGGI